MCFMINFNIVMSVTIKFIKNFYIMYRLMSLINISEGPKRWSAL
jgi:hypothetical protein